MNTKIILTALIILAAGVGIYFNLQPKDLQGITYGNDAEVDSPLTPTEEITAPESEQQEQQKTMQNRIATFTTNKGVIKIELFEDTMPITTGNFIKLAEEKYFDGIKFHRVIDGFMIQSGDPLTKDDSKSAYWGTGGPGYAIPDEHVAGPLLTNTRGTISMANSGPNSGGSQFFINVNDNVFLDFNKEPFQSKHPVFGRVTLGMDVVDAISMAPRNGRDVPNEPIVITSITIGTN